MDETENLTVEKGGPVTVACYWGPQVLPMWRGPTIVACYWGPQVSPMCCTLARAWRTPNNSTSMFLSHLCRFSTSPNPSY
ncbi:hypothetical protein ACOSP7_020571 [Xanthoceras sorbifolium]